MPAELNYTVHERELLALVSIITKHSYWLMGTKFRIFTDHQTLVRLNKQEVLSRREARWVLTLQDYDMMVVYISGEENNVADLLSRSPAVAPKCAYCESYLKPSVVSLN